MKYFVGFVDEV